MVLTLYAHPFSSYCQKALIALYENEITFEYRNLEEEGAGAELAALWPIGKFPVLTDGDRTIAEASIIIEYLQTEYPGNVRLIPSTSAEALEVRFLDRVFDNHIMSLMQSQVGEALRQKSDRLDEVRAQTGVKLDLGYGWLNDRLAGRTWAAGEDFTMADCAAAPSLFYADWVHEIGPRFANLRAYRSRLLERPSFARAVNEARPYRKNFPLGAPDRD